MTSPSRVAAMGLIVVPTLVGYAGLAYTLRGYRHRRARAGVFLDLLEQYARSAGEDHEAYEQLVLRSVKMQADVGALGLAAMKPRGNQMVIRNYQVIINELSEMKRYLPMDHMLSSIRPGDESKQFIRDSIVRYLGALGEWESATWKTIKNPMAAFAEGVRLLLSFPVFVLESIGLAPPQSSTRLGATRGFKLVSGGMAFLGLLASIVGLITGWAAFVKILRDWFIAVSP